MYSHLMNIHYQFQYEDQKYEFAFIQPKHKTKLKIADKLEWSSLIMLIQHRQLA